MTTIVISVTHSLVTEHTVELPCANWGEVEEFYVEWNTLHCMIDGEWVEVDLRDLDPSELDVKSPTSVEVLEVRL